jgi:hypothetical protein
MLTADAARRIAINIARLPELPGKRIEGQRAMVGPWLEPMRTRA